MRIVVEALIQTWQSIVHYLPYLAVGIILASVVQVYMDPRRWRKILGRYAGTAILPIVLFATVTPFCSCGTMAVTISMLASTVPWGPIVAFMVSSPLMSPSEFIYAAGVLGWPFAAALLVASIAVGVGAGYLAIYLEKKGFLRGQARSSHRSEEGSEACACDGQEIAAAACSDCGRGQRQPAISHLQRIAKAALAVGPRIILMYVAFSLIGHVLSGLMPSEWLLGLFGRGRFYAVPLAATAGLPLYLNAEVSMPLIRTFVQGGMSPGAALALIISGAGTSIGAIAGAFVIARRRVVGLVVGSLWAGAIIAGYAYDLILTLLG